MERDRVDEILEQWARERPDLDASPIGLIGRLHRLGDVLNVALRRVFAEEGLGDGDFDVLVTLRRNGAPYELTPSELAASTMVTSSAVTKRIDRLEQGGLVTRTVSAADARSRRVRLTEEGRALVDRLMARHVANEARLVSGLSPAERDQLATLLRKWTLSLE